MFYTVYKITNLVNRKYYIGKHQTKKLNDGYMGSGKRLWQAIKKYKIENFKKEILHIFDNEIDMNSKETELIILNRQTYNLCRGGYDGFGYINRNKLNVYHITKENAKELSTRGIKKKQDLFLNDTDWVERYRENLSKSLKAHFDNGGIGSFKNKNHTEETKTKIKLSSIGKHIGNKNSQFGTCWIKNCLTRECSKINRIDLEYWMRLGWEIGKLQTNVKYVKLEVQK
jgi:hypothetical protein